MSQKLLVTNALRRVLVRDYQNIRELDPEAELRNSDQVNPAEEMQDLRGTWKVISILGSIFGIVNRFL